MKKLCLIGCGGIGAYHLSHFLQYKDIVELAGFCDLIPERAADYAKKAGCEKYYTDYKQMYDQINPDMVFICVPPYCHGEIENETIRRGIHFFVEKPLALSMDLAKDILKKIKENNIITAVGFQCRYSALIEPNKKFVDENRIIFTDCVRMGGIPENEWWKDKKKSGGQLVEQTIHQVDLLRYFLGEPEEVSSFATTGFVKNVEAYQTDDLSTSIIRFKSGGLCTVSTGCYVTGGDAFESKVTFSSTDKRADLKILSTFEIYGESQNDNVTENDGFVIKGDGGFTTSSDGAKVYREEGDVGILCDRTFIEAVISGDSSKIRSPYEDAMKTLSLVLACNQSMENGRSVKVDLDF